MPYFWACEILVASGAGQLTLPALQCMTTYLFLRGLHWRDPALYPVASLDSWFRRRADSWLGHFTLAEGTASLPWGGATSKEAANGPCLVP